jgi:ferrochelatase
VRTAILLLNLGGPSTLDEVEPFLANLFADPEIISFPFSRWFQGPLARLIARKRGRSSASATE